MELRDCLDYVGLPSTDRLVKELLSALGCTKEPKCKKSDPDFDWSNEAHCVELLFKDEDRTYALMPIKNSASN